MDSGGMRKFCGLAFVAVLVAYSSAFLYWMHTVNPLLPVEDGGGYLYQSFVTYDNLKENPAGIASIFLHCEFNRKPPMLFFSVALGYFIFGESIPAAYLVVLLWVILIFHLLYGIGAQLGDRCIGLAAVLFTIGFSWFHYTVIAFLTEIPLLAFLLLGIHLTFKPDVLRDWKKTLLLGLCISGGILSRLEFTFFFLPVGTYLIISNLQTLRKGAVLRLAALVLPVLVLGVPWYWVNYENAVVASRGVAFASDKSVLERVLDWENLMYYPRFYYQSSPLFFILALAALVAALFSEDSRLKMMAATVIFVFIVYFFAKAKIVRYVIPVLPLSGVLAGSLVSRLKNKKALAVVLSLMVCISTQATYTFFFEYRNGRLEGKPWYLYDKSVELVDLISRYQTGPAQVNPTTYLLGSYNSGNLMAVSRLKGSQIIVNDLVAWVAGGPNYNISAIYFPWVINTAGYILRTNRTECAISYAPIEDCNAVIRNLQAEFERQRSNFTKIGSIHSELDGEIEIYKRRVDNGSTG